MYQVSNQRNSPVSSEPTKNGFESLNLTNAVSGVATSAGQNTDPEVSKLLNLAAVPPAYGSTVLASNSPGVQGAVFVGVRATLELNGGSGTAPGATSASAIGGSQTADIISANNRERFEHTQDTFSPSNFKIESSMQTSNAGIHAAGEAAKGIADTYGMKERDKENFISSAEEETRQVAAAHLAALTNKS